uniref:Si:ch211-196h16.12 n=1 Tax=Gasterosteus aculeatus TaxID=69293 RepID=G3Q5F2_GASAC
MCKGLSSLPSSCLEKAKEMRVKLSHLAETHHKQKFDFTSAFNNESIYLLQLQDPGTVHPGSLALKQHRASVDLISKTRFSGGRQAFRDFLRSEFSEENLEFWLACEDYRVASLNLQKTKSSSIYSQFINPDAPQEVNLDAETREALLSVTDFPCADTFNDAQQRIYNLMAKDSFPRFLRSPQCMEAIK